jgi:hypothetical protein
MVRTVVKPEDQNISIKLTKHFIGKQVEVIAFTIEETEIALNDAPLTHFASENILAKEWFTDEEDLAWQDL